MRPNASMGVKGLIELQNYYKNIYQCKEDHSGSDLEIDKTLSDSSIMSNNKSSGSDGFSKHSGKN